MDREVLIILHRPSTQSVRRIPVLCRPGDESIAGEDIAKHMGEKWNYQGFKYIPQEIGRVV